LTEQAGGKATNGQKRILDINPKQLHQRVPFYCGNAEMINRLVGFLAQ
jgi:fructose-1,6-bisphosphatase I